MGSPVIYTSTSADLFARYKVPVATPWALLALKDHDANTPAAVYYAPSQVSSHPGADLKAWLLANRLPTVIELTQDSFQEVMHAPHKPLVVIAAVNKDNKGKIAEKFADLGAMWRARGGGSNVVFAWMDAERWAKWMKSMYGIVDGPEPTIVVADHSVSRIRGYLSILTALPAPHLLR